MAPREFGARGVGPAGEPLTSTCSRVVGGPRANQADSRRLHILSGVVALAVHLSALDLLASPRGNLVAGGREGGQDTESPTAGERAQRATSPRTAGPRARGRGPSRSPRTARSSPAQMACPSLSRECCAGCGATLSSGPARHRAWRGRDAQLGDVAQHLAAGHVHHLHLLDLGPRGLARLADGAALEALRVASREGGGEQAVGPAPPRAGPGRAGPVEPLGAGAPSSSRWDRSCTARASSRRRRSRPAASRRRTGAGTSSTCAGEQTAPCGWRGPERRRGRAHETDGVHGTVPA